MRMFDIIKKKQSGGELSREEIRYFIRDYVKGIITDYQASALLMAIFFKGMSDEETAELTFAISDSGNKPDLSAIKGIRADKHSTGGVGDKTSLVVVPVVASLGIKVAKLSGRGLGHTGGTVDKLESIPGFRTDLTEKDFISQVNSIGAAIGGQSRDIAPADKKLYALRDVTATVSSLPLIVSSIMGKKLAVSDDCIVLDVKTGSGAFMKTPEESRKLAAAMVNIGKKAGRKIMAVITDMDRPLGNAIGNSVEVEEAIETLKGRGPGDLTELSAILSGAILHLAGKGSIEECREMALKAMSDGSALRVFGEMIKAQGGDPGVIDDSTRFRTPGFVYEIKAPESGYISHMDTEAIGRAALILGAGRSTIEDVIDPAAGIILKKKTGDHMEKGDIIAELRTSDESTLKDAEEAFIGALAISGEKPDPVPLVYDYIV